MITEMHNGSLQLNQIDILPEIQSKPGLSSDAKSVHPSAANSTFADYEPAGG